MAVTLNGVAQGYITDRVADLLRGRGFENVLVELGEVRALGRCADLEPWRAGIADPEDPSAVLLELPLLDSALATSGSYGTWLDPAHRHHHIFDPATGRSAHRQAMVSVTAPRAMVADALSICADSRRGGTCTATTGNIRTCDRVPVWAGRREGDHPGLRASFATLSTLARASGWQKVDGPNA